MKQMAQKLLLCFNFISAEILLKTLGDSFCAEPHILVDFLQNVVLIKSIKKYLHKSCSAMALKMLVKLNLDVCVQCTCTYLGSL